MAMLAALHPMAIFGFGGPDILGALGDLFGSFFSTIVDHLFSGGSNSGDCSSVSTLTKYLLSGGTYDTTPIATPGSGLPDVHVCPSLQDAQESVWNIASVWTAVIGGAALAARVVFVAWTDRDRVFNLVGENVPRLIIAIGAVGVPGNASTSPAFLAIRSAIGFSNTFALSLFGSLEAPPQGLAGGASGFDWGAVGHLIISDAAAQLLGLGSLVDLLFLVVIYNLAAILLILLSRFFLIIFLLLTAPLVIPLLVYGRNRFFTEWLNLLSGVLVIPVIAAAGMGGTLLLSNVFYHGLASTDNHHTMFSVVPGFILVGMLLGGTMVTHRYMTRFSHEFFGGHSSTALNVAGGVLGGSLAASAVKGKLGGRRAAMDDEVRDGGGAGGAQIGVSNEGSKSAWATTWRSAAAHVGRNVVRRPVSHVGGAMAAAGVGGGLLGRALTPETSRARDLYMSVPRAVGRFAKNPPMAISGLQSDVEAARAARQEARDSGGGVPVLMGVSAAMANHTKRTAPRFDYDRAMTTVLGSRGGRALIAAAGIPTGTAAGDAARTLRTDDRFALLRYHLTDAVDGAVRSSLARGETPDPARVVLDDATFSAIRSAAGLPAPTAIDSLVSPSTATLSDPGGQWLTPEEAGSGLSRAAGAGSADGGAEGV